MTYKPALSLLALTLIVFLGYLSSYVAKPTVLTHHSGSELPMPVEAARPYRST
jgi:hypothetical protein